MSTFMRLFHLIYSSVNSYKPKKSLIYGASILISALIISSSYNACQKVNFQNAESDAMRKLSKEGLLLIENGASFTNKKQVLLTLNFNEATEMFITDDPNCEVGGEIRGEWEAFQPNRFWDLGRLNEQIVLFAKFKGREGNSEGCARAQIVHDNIPPEINLPTLPSPVSPLRLLMLNFEVVDILSGVESTSCVQSFKGNVLSRVDSCSNGQNFSMNEEGANKMEVEAFDKAGNRAYKEFSWGSDFTPPTVVWAQTPNNPSPPQNSMNQFSFNVNDNVGLRSVQCSLAPSGSPSSFSDCNNSYVPSSDLSINTSYVFTVKAIDLAGLTTELQYLWDVKDGIPSLLITDKPLPYDKKSGVQFKFVGVYNGQDLKSYSCKLDSDAVSSDCGSKVFSRDPVQEGRRKFTVVGIYNKDGDPKNQQEITATYSWISDRSPPVIQSLVGPNPYTNNTASASFSWVVQDAPNGIENSGISGVQCTLDGQTVNCATSFSQSYSGLHLSDGVHNFSILVVDQAGNSSSKNYSWIVDTQKPIVTITQKPLLLTQEVVAKFDFSAVENSNSLDRFECSLDGAAFTNCGGGASILTGTKTYGAQPESQLTSKGYLFQVRAIDLAGNYSEPAMWNWSVDNLGPAIVINERPWDHELVLSKDNKIGFSVHDLPGSISAGVDRVYCDLVDSASSEPTKLCTLGAGFKYEINYNQLPAGNYFYKIGVFDKLGNFSSTLLEWKISNGFEVKSKNLSITKTNKLDLLFIIDNSQSMTQEQVNLSSKIGNFLSKIQDLDWRIGITTTDVESYFVLSPAVARGELAYIQASPYSATNFKILTPASPIPSGTTLQGILGTTIQSMGTSGSGNEMGLKATKMVIEKRASNQLFRPQAYFSVVLITDEDETVGGMAPADLDQYIKSTLNPIAYNFNSITYQESDINCSAYKTISEKDGLSYVEMSRLSGGINGNICLNDYTTQLLNIGDSVRNLTKKITLDCEPKDINGDGKIDITFQPATTPEIKAINGNTVEFMAQLENGEYTVNYYCSK